ncbi:hypothetical protein L1987_89063 [Smallanthus sonchifolius]|nr:hypothetical protein L1987_89063 [Smallanthus sonchifolius]
MFPTYPLVIPMIPRCTYSPQPSVQIYLGYGHCTPIVVSPISASVGGTYAEMTGRSRPIENRGMTMYSFPYGAHGVAYFERGRRGEDCRVTKELRRNAERIADMPLDMSSRSDLARGRIEMPIDEVGEASLPAKGDCLLFDENEKGN